MSRLDTMTDADLDRLRDALWRLVYAARSYIPEQSTATDPQCRADSDELLAALRDAWEVLDDRR
jgi:hypothetical protein